MSAYPASPLPSFPPVPHTAPTYPINLPPIPPMVLRPQYYPHAHHTSLNPTNQRGRNLRRESVGYPVDPMRAREGAGLGHMGTTKIGHVQAPFTALQRLPPPTSLNQLRNFGLPSPAPISVPSPRPHPHLTSTDLYISHVPPELPEAAIAEALRDCCPVRINLSVPVRHSDRLKPDNYYEWMPRSGTLHFMSLHSAEKALVILIGHPSLADAGLIVSTYPPPTSPHHLPHVLPFPDPPVPARYLRPTQHISTPQSAHSKDPVVALSSQVPALGELFDIVRPWGSLRQITVWLEKGQSAESDQLQPALSWGARVSFWYEDEARRFEMGFGATGFLIKGWQIRIFAEQPMIIGRPMSESLPVPFPQPNNHFLPSTVNPPIQLGQHGNNIDPEIFRRMGMPLFPSIPSLPSPHHHPQPFAPLSPPLDFNPPWANHNIFAGPIQPPTKATPGWDRRMSVPTGSNNIQLGSRRSLGNVHDHSPGGNGALGRQKTWSIQLESSIEGELIPTGIRSNEGEFIHHGPGHHIRPAPLVGPGSSSASGLVDYSNVYVKNLDSDICSFFLEDLFSNLGRIVSAKVMRDDEGRSRGYGFVSFYSPKEAAHAITVMNSTRVGSQQIAMTLHEPRKLRQEKQAERMGTISGNTSRRGSTVGTRQDSPMSARRGSQLGPLGLGSLVSARFDDIRPLSPESQKHALIKQNTNLSQTPQFADGSAQSIIETSALHDLSIDSTSSEADATFVPRVSPRDQASSSNATSSPSTPDLSTGRSITLTEAESHASLVSEIAKIDPDEAQAIMNILWPLLHPFERQRALESRGFLAVKYGLAKRELIKRRLGENLGSPTSTSSPSPLTPSHSSTITTETSSSTSQIDLIPLREITFDSLASRSASDIMAHLSSSVGTLILEKLGTGRPTSEEAGQLARWILNVREKTVRERDTEICTAIAGYFQLSWGKKSTHLKVARGLIDIEDIGALCKLIAYPKLLDAKARLHYESGKS